MRFRLYRFSFINENDILSSLIWKNFPLLDDSIHIPFSKKCYVIIESDKSDQIPDRLVVQAPSQKPSVLFIQPLGESIDIELNKKYIVTDLEFIFGDNIKAKISKEINSNKSNNVLLVASNIVSYFEEKIIEDRR